MQSEAPIPDLNDGSNDRRLDRLSLVLAVLTVAILGWTAWLRFGPARPPEAPGIGSLLPPVRLLDLQTNEPSLLVGARGKVVWVVFWSAGSSSSRSLLPRLEAAWKRLKLHRGFTLVAAADATGRDQVRAELAQARATLPAYLAAPETLRRFGLAQASPPLHYLMSADGRVGAMARGEGQDTINRLAAQAEDWLEVLDPAGGTRFANANPGFGANSDREAAATHSGWKRLMYQDGYNPPLGTQCDARSDEGAGCRVATRQRPVLEHGRRRGTLSSWTGPSPSRPLQDAVLYGQRDQSNAGAPGTLAALDQGVGP